MPDSKSEGNKPSKQEADTETPRKNKAGHVAPSGNVLPSDLLVLCSPELGYNMVPATIMRA